MTYFEYRLVIVELFFASLPESSWPKNREQ